MELLRRLAIDGLKLAPALLRQPAHAEVLGAIVGLSHALKLQVVAGGIETEQQMSELRATECDFAQGFLVSVPVEALAPPLGAKRLRRTTRITIEEKSQSSPRGVMNPIRLSILERELESVSLMTLEAAEELEARAETGADADAAVLAQAVVHLALKASFLIWRGGRRLSDRYAAEEAEHLQQRLELTEHSPLAPAQLSPMADLLGLSNGELLRAVDPAMMMVTLHGVTRSLRPLVAALSRVAMGLGGTAEPHVEGGVPAL